PCSEIYFDRGEKYGCGSPTCGVGCDCDRYTEIWNLVFTQFNNDGNGNYTRLKSCNIDTGMGLERLACVMQGVDNLFEVDTVRNIMKKVIDISGVKYRESEKSDISLRVITDHIRSSTFMIGDGVMPSNEGRGYVLRRLLRRAARHGKLLGINEPFLYQVCGTVIDENESAYPNLREKQELITKVIRAEEENFARTIDNGLNMLNTIIADRKSGVLSGADAFKLQDTFGFPIDLTKELLSEKGMTVDEEEFRRISLESRKAARAARKDAGAEAWKGTATVLRDVSPTLAECYDKMQSESSVAAIVVDGERCEYVGAGCEAVIVLNNTPFYAESGGQVGDRGTVSTDSAVFEVINTTKTQSGVILHTGRLISGKSIAVGDKVRAHVNEEKRRATMRNHTAAHLLQAALRKVLGTHVEQAGQLVSENAVRFDFVHFSAMTADEIKKVERLVNEEILSAVRVEKSEMPIEEAKKLGAMALFGEKYGDIVRVVRVGDFSIELCGGTHVDDTGELGLFKIVSESSVAAGVRRIEGCTGYGVLDYLDGTLETMRKAAASLKISNVSEFAAKAASIAADLKAKDREIEKLKAEIANIKASSALSGVIDLGGLKLVTAFLEDTTPDELRKMCDMVRSRGDEYIGVVAGVQKAKGTGNICVVCGKAAIERGAHAGNIARETAKLAGGSGGGKPDSAMAGAKETDKLPAAVEKAADIIRSMIS
ncbi:MAG: alanine--tRNA ligase, partial [Acutalibacteraceae bacterium]